MKYVEVLAGRFKVELIGRILTACITGLLIITLARLLNPTDYGLLFLVLSVLGVLELFSTLGISRSGARYIAEFKEKNNHQITHIIKTVFMLNTIPLIIVTSFLYFFHDRVADWVGEPSLAPLLYLGILYVFFGTLFTAVNNILQGFERIRLAAIFRVLREISIFVFSVGFVIYGVGAFGALLGYVVGILLASVTGMFVLYTEIYTNFDDAPTIESGLRRRIAEYSVSITATNVSGILDNRIDVILVGFFLNPLNVGFYTISKQIISFIEVPMAALGFTVSPTYASQKAKGNKKIVSEIYENTMEYSLLLYIPAAAGLILVAEPAIELVFGSDYIGAVPVLQVLALLAVFKAITNITSDGLDYLGRARTRAIAKGITSLMNVGLNILLIPAIGVIGAAIATVVTYGIYTFVNIYIAYQEIGFNVRRLLISSIYILFISIIMSVVVFSILNFKDSLIMLPLSILLGIIVWLFLSLCIGLIKVNKLRRVIR